MAGDCDAVVCAIVRVFDGGTDAVHDALTEVAASATKPVIGALLGFRPATEVDWEPDQCGEGFRASTEADQRYPCAGGGQRLRPLAGNAIQGAVPMLDNRPQIGRGGW